MSLDAPTLDAFVDYVAKHDAHSPLLDVAYSDLVAVVVRDAIAQAAARGWPLAKGVIMSSSLICLDERVIDAVLRSAERQGAIRAAGDDLWAVTDATRVDPLALRDAARIACRVHPAACPPPDSRSPRKLLTACDAAKLLGCCEKTLWTLTQRGDIPAVKIGRAVRYDPADVDRWIARAKA